MSQTIKAKECRFAVYMRPPEWGEPDMHLIKEQVLFEDGTQKPVTRLVENYERPFWITKKALQNHKDKKEWEDKENLIQYKTTQSNLQSGIAAALDTPYFRGSMKDLCMSPYVYGADVLSTSYIKYQYKQKWPDIDTPYTVATLDIETDVIGKDDITLITITFQNKVYTAIYSPFVRKVGTLDDRLREAIKYYLKDYIDLSQWSFDFKVFDHHIAMLQSIFDQLHEWKPDFLAIWNIDFDIQEIEKLIRKYKMDPKDFYSDPCVPDKYRFYRYKQGPKKKVTASGKVTPISPAAQWHTLFTPSSFYVVDAMCAYKQIRTGRPEEPSYALDAILELHLGVRKLRFKEADHLSGLEWHQFMQSNYPVEYIVYNMFDAISMQELDKKTMDLSLVMPLFSGISDFENFNKQPRRASDAMHFYCLEKKDKVIGTTGKVMTDDFDSMTIGLSGWIITLPAHLIHDNGIKCIQESEELRTNIRLYVSDLDIRAAYPTGEMVCNISKETTHRELVTIKGVSESIYRMQNINLSSGRTNALEYCQTMFGFPKLNDLDAEYRKYKEQRDVSRENA